MGGNTKRKNDNAQRGGGNTSKRQRRATRAPLVFEQGVNPAPPTPPLTARKQRRSHHRQSQQNAHSYGRSSAQTPASQLAVDAQTDVILEIAEDDDAEEEEEEEEEEEGPPREDVEAATMVSEHAASVTGDSPGVAAATSVASSSQSQR